MRFFVCPHHVAVRPIDCGTAGGSENRSLSGHSAVDVLDIVPPEPQTAGPASQKKELTLGEAIDVSFNSTSRLSRRLRNETADAEKLTARLRPNPEFDASFDDLPLDFSGPFFREQEIPSYGISQTFELGGKRRKRINAANANSELARAIFQVTMWQLTNDLKRKFYTVVLAEDLLKLAEDNEKTFGEILKHSTELVQQGEIAGLDLRKIESRN